MCPECRLILSESPREIGHVYRCARCSQSLGSLMLVDWTRFECSVAVGPSCHQHSDTTASHNMSGLMESSQFMPTFISNYPLLWPYSTHSLYLRLISTSTPWGTHLPIEHTWKTPRCARCTTGPRNLLSAYKLSDRWLRNQVHSPHRHLLISSFCFLSWPICCMRNKDNVISRG